MGLYRIAENEAFPPDRRLREYQGMDVRVLFAFPPDRRLRDFGLGRQHKTVPLPAG